MVKKTEIKIPLSVCVDDVSSAECDVDLLVLVAVVVVGEVVVTAVVSGPTVQTTKYQ